MLEVLCKVEFRSLVICSPYHPMLSFALWCFLLYIVDFIRPPPSFGSWFDTLHLWPVVRPHGDPPLPLCPWWKEDCIPWCCLKRFCIHCKRCKFRVLQEQTHVLFMPPLQSSYRWINIILLVNGIHTLANVVIVNPTQADLVSLAALSHGVVVTLAIHVKEGFYHNYYPTDVFFLLAI